MTLILRGALLQTGVGAALACGFLLACSGRTTPAPAPALAIPPPAPDAAPPATNVTRTFAMTDVFLGDTLRDGTVSTKAWTEYGYDLDGKLTTSSSRDVCVPQPGAGRDPQVDGVGGIDNAWGARALPLLETLRHNVSSEMTATIRRGAFTYLFEARGLTDDPTQTNTLVAGQVFLGAALGRTPSFAPDESWPVAAGALATGALSGGAKAFFAASYVTAGHWVSAPLGDLVLHIDLGAGENYGDRMIPAIDVPIHRAIVTFDHPAPAQLAHGVIAGILSAEELVRAAMPALTRLGTPGCGGIDAASVAQLIRQTSDIMLDGTNSPDAPCDAISIGIGFEAVEVANAAQVGADPEPVLPPCGDGTPAADAGAD